MAQKRLTEQEWMAPGTVEVSLDSRLSAQLATSAVPAEVISLSIVKTESADKNDRDGRDENRHKSLYCIGVRQVFSFLDLLPPRHFLC